MKKCEFDDDDGKSCKEEADVVIDESEYLCYQHACQRLLSQMNEWDAKLAIDLSGHGYVLKDEYRTL